MEDKATRKCPGQTHLSSLRRNIPEPLRISILGSWPPGLQNNKVLFFKTLTGRVKEGGQCWYVILSRDSAHSCQVCFDGELSSSTALFWAEAVSLLHPTISSRAENSSGAPCNPHISHHRGVLWLSGYPQWV